MTNSLTLLAKTSTVGDVLSGDQVAELRYMEFVIDGQALGRTLGPFIGYEDATREYVPVLVSNWPDESAAADVQRLLGEQPDPLLGGRVAVYVCAECGDLACGAVTAAVEVGTECVVWRDLGFQDNAQPFDQAAIFEGVGPFTFDRTSYADTLGAFLRHLPRSQTATP